MAQPFITQSLPRAGQNGAGYYLRLYYPALETDQRVEQSLDFAQKAGVDGVLLFEASYDMDPALLTLETLEKRFARLQVVAPRFRAQGFAVHINMMITMGHVDAGCARPERFAFQFIVNAEGAASRSSACPLDPNFLEHVRAQYHMAAGCHPGAIWVDDDTSYLIHDLAGLACFCPLHLQRVSERTGQVWTREALVAALSGNLEARGAWLDVQEESILAYARTIESAVHAVDPHVRVGLMTVGTSFHAAEGRRSDRLLRALAGNTRPLIRPGSGFWNDWTPGGVLDKSEDGARQVALIGPDVQAFAEIENHPYNAFCKSDRVLLLELGLDVLAGMPDLSLNLLTSMGGTGPLEPEGTQYAGLLARHRPYLNALAREWSGRIRQGVGVSCLEETPRHARWQIHPAAGRQASESSAVILSAVIEPRPWEHMLARLGLPVGRPEQAPHWIAGETARALSDEVFNRWLREGAVLDPIAAQVCLERGWGAHLGLRAVQPVADGVNEQITGGPRAGEILPVYNHIPYDDLATYKVDDVQSQVLSRWLNVDGQDRGPAAVLLHSGAGVQGEMRAALLPYRLRAPAPVLLNMAHRDQWAAMLEWVAQRPLPCRVTRGANLYPLCFYRPADQSWLVAIANLSADDVTGASFALSFQQGSGPAGKAERLDPDGAWRQAEALDGNIPAFSLAVWRYSYP